MRKGWLWALAPLALASLIALPLLAGWVPNPLYSFTGDLAAYVLTVGGLLTALLTFLAWQAWQNQRYRFQVLSNLRLQEAEHRGQFLQRLDHEMKNPLGAVRFNLDNLKNTSLSPEQRDLVAAIDTQVARANRVTTEIRRIVDMRMRKLIETEIDLAHLAQEVVEFVVGQGKNLHPFLAGGKRPTVHRPTNPLPLVWGDDELLQIAVYNLVQNACKFTPPTGRVEVQAGAQGPWVMLRVVDTGRGIAKEDLLRIGEELYRSQSALDVPGQGLGFAMARAIVERHGGTLTIDSREGQGAWATMRLPQEHLSPEGEKSP